MTEVEHLTLKQLELGGVSTNQAEIAAWCGGRFIETLQLNRVNKTTIGLLLSALVWSGCSTAHFRRSADQETSGIIDEKTPSVPNMDPDFSIVPAEDPVFDGLPKVEKATEFLGDEGKAEVGAYKISLEKALELAVKHNRNYQTHKELVYLDGLNLTLARHRFAPIFSGSGGADYRGAVEEVTIGVDEIIENHSSHSASVSGNAGTDRLLKSGARIGTDFTIDFVRFITGNRNVSSSRLSATLIQPLLRGGGYQVTMENLTQAERGMLYSLRDFTRFRKEFSVQIAAAYYRILLNRDIAGNNWLGYQNFKVNADRVRAFVEEGRQTQSDLGQLEQAELSSESGWINAVRNYQQALDDFKVVQLGLPASAPLVLDETELERLQLEHPDMSIEEAVKVALATRLDLYTASDRAKDAFRRVKVASNGLLPGLDVILSGGLESEPNKPFAFDFDRATWNAGVDLDLPFDRKAERNAYRASLITYDRAVREKELAEDLIKLEITESERNLDQAKRQFEINELGVRLSQNRVEEEQLRLEIGIGLVRDLVDAQTDLIDALNQRASTLVNHTIGRFNFWLDMGILTIEENGRWKEVRNEESEDNENTQ